MKSQTGSWMVDTNGTRAIVMENRENTCLGWKEANNHKAT